MSTYNPVEHDPERFAGDVTRYLESRDAELRDLTKEKVRHRIDRDNEQIRVAEGRLTKAEAEIVAGDEFVKTWDERRKALVAQVNQTRSRLWKWHVAVAACDSFIREYFGRKDYLARMRERARKLEREIQFLEQHGTLPAKRKPVKARKGKRHQLDLPTNRETNL